MSEDRQVSPWVYVAVGCSVPILLIVVLVGAAVFWGYRLANHVKNDTPDQRAAQAKAVLGCSELPEGYQAAMTMSIPFLMEMTILSDRPPAFHGPSQKLFDERGFIYVSARGGARKQKRIHDYIEGKGSAAGTFEGDNEVQVGTLEPIHRGSFEQASMGVAYVASRGGLTARGQPLDGIVTLFEFKCPSDSKHRIGIWFGPDPRKGAPADDPAAYAGTPADESRIRDFIGHFSPCAGTR